MQSERMQINADRPFAALAAYLSELESATPSGHGLALSEQAAGVVRAKVDIVHRREAGTFFSSPRVAEQLVRPYKIGKNILRVFDPACGTGDLLIAALRHLSADRNLTVGGAELLPELMAIARRRVSLESGLPQLNAVKEVEGGDGRLSPNLGRADLVVLNPPYNMVDNGQYSWGAGRRTAAAEFVESTLAAMQPGAQLAAVLPDVLRGGPSYGRWRDCIARLADIDEIESLGVFDKWTNVDVFILRATRSAAPEVGWPLPLEVGTTPVLDDLFLSKIGEVVPHRSAQTDSRELAPYCTVKNIPSWSSVLHVDQQARFDSPLHEGPFVVLRRTAAPSQKPRVRASVINLSTPCFVENHLIMLTPRDGALASCADLVAQLRDPRVDLWLNTRSRTRHITLHDIRELPLGSSAQP